MLVAASICLLGAEALNGSHLNKVFLRGDEDGTALRGAPFTGQCPSCRHQIADRSRPIFPSSRRRYAQAQSHDSIGKHFKTTRRECRDTRIFSRLDKRRAQGHALWSSAQIDGSPLGLLTPV
jgi:uncharacterized protein YcfJ